MQRYIDITSINHNISILLALLLTACASLVFFLPAAISMNAPAPLVITGGIDAHHNPHWTFEPTIEPLHAGDMETDATGNLAGQFIDQKNGMLPDGDPSEVRNKKNSLPLKTAAIIGTSSAVAAAFLAGEGVK